MSKRKLKIFFVLILIALISIFAITIISSNNRKYKETVYKSNSQEVFGQGTSMIRYGNNIYFFDNSKFALLELNTNENKVNQITTSNDIINDNLYIVNNCLIFSTNGKSYYMELDSKNKEIKELVKGEVKYIDENNIVYVENLQDIAHLQIIAYNKTNFTVDASAYFELAYGNKIEYIKKTDNFLYFGAENSDGSASLFYVDMNKENPKVVLVCRQDQASYDFNLLKVVDAIKLDELYYYFVAARQYSANTGAYYDEYDLWAFDMKMNYSEHVTDTAIPNLYLSPDKNELLLYRVYSDAQNGWEWNESFISDKYDFTDIVKGDVKDFMTLKGEELIINGKVTTLSEIYSEDYRVESATYFDNYFYVQLFNGEHGKWYKISKDGTNPIKIYEY